MSSREACSSEKMCSIQAIAAQARTSERKSSDDRRMLQGTNKSSEHNLVDGALCEHNNSTVRFEWTAGRAHLNIDSGHGLRTIDARPAGQAQVWPEARQQNKALHSIASNRSRLATVQVCLQLFVFDVHQPTPSGRAAFSDGLRCSSASFTGILRDIEWPMQRCQSGLHQSGRRTNARASALNNPTKIVSKPGPAMKHKTNKNACAPRAQLV